MSEAIREVLADPEVMKAIMKNTDKKPPYWDMMPTKNGITAIVIAQMLKAMGGDTAAFTALSKFGFGEKVQMEVSDFYRTGAIEISIVQPKTIEQPDTNMIEEGVIDEAVDGTIGPDAEANEGVE